MDYLVKIRSVQTPLNGQFSIGANSSAMLFCLMFGYFDAPKIRKNQRVRFWTWDKMVHIV